jgi:hypothetical protein
MRAWSQSDTLNHLNLMTIVTFGWAASLGSLAGGCQALRMPRSSLLAGICGTEIPGIQCTADQRFAAGAQLVDNYPSPVHPNATMIVMIVES